MLKYILPSLMILGMASLALAQSGQFQNLEWSNPKEELIYHSCGCADSCWVADLQDTKTHLSKIKLSCDCEVMHLEINGQEIAYTESCQVFEKEDKFKKIAHEILSIQSAK